VKTLKSQRQRAVPLDDPAFSSLLLYTNAYPIRSVPTPVGYEDYVAEPIGPFGSSTD